MQISFNNIWQFSFRIDFKILNIRGDLQFAFKLIKDYMYQK